MKCPYYGTPCARVACQVKCELDLKREEDPAPRQRPDCGMCGGHGAVPIPGRHSNDPDGEELCPACGGRG